MRIQLACNLEQEPTATKLAEDEDLRSAEYLPPGARHLNTQMRCSYECRTQRDDGQGATSETDKPDLKRCM